jgi:hypothetical protein
MTDESHATGPKRRPSRRAQPAVAEVHEEPSAQAPAKPPSLRTRERTETVSWDMKRFDIFLIDTGWNQPVSKVVQAHLPTMHAYHKQDSLYILSREQSIEILRREPHLIGRDPTILVYDLYAPKGSATGNYRGFRIHLGRFRSGEKALARLHEFLRFISLHRCVENLDREVKRELHREGVSGAVRLLREASEASVELL